MNLIFELTNEQRKYLGLIPVEEHWELVKFDDNIYHYFEGDNIKKEITVSENYYHESELNEKTTENRTMILPKTKRGKIKKFNYTAVQSFSPFGTYFTFSAAQVIIANYTTQRTYYSESFPESENITIDDLKKWLDTWIEETGEEDLKEIEEFKSTKRKHCKFKECIEAKSNSPFWEKYNKKNVPDLKNPDHIELKRKVFKAFGLDADMQAGRTKNVNEVFADIRKDYGL